MRRAFDHALLEELLHLVLEQANLNHPAVPGELLIWRFGQLLLL
jgi:hypothetical protein